MWSGVNGLAVAAANAFTKLSASATGTTSTACPSNRESFSVACSFSDVTASLTSAVLFTCFSNLLITPSNNPLSISLYSICCKFRDSGAEEPEHLSVFFLYKHSFSHNRYIECISGFADINPEYIFSRNCSLSSLPLSWVSPLTSVGWTTCEYICVGK